MKRIFFILSIICLLSNNIRADVTILDKDVCNVVQKSDSLKSLYSIITKSKMTDIKKEYVLFFQTFPSDFDCFIDIYGFRMDGNDYSSMQLSPLYDESFEHIELFFKTKDYIKKENFISKLIDVSLYGYWDADAISIFKMNLFDFLENNLKSFYEILSKYNNNQIKSFWTFYFDEPHPENYDFDYLKKIDEWDKPMYKIIQDCYREALINGCGGH